MMLTFGSLFSGIGGIDLGLERAGMICKWQVEIDDYATRVLAKHWPDVPRFRDVRSVGAHNLSRVDVLAGGFPCQDISNAGKRAGITGERSGLWSEFARLIRELQPHYVFVENVPALLGRGMGRILGDLAAIGYDAEWQCISAAAIGAPHIRDRLFILAYPDRAERREIAEGWNESNGDNARWEEATGRFTARGTNGRTADVVDADRQLHGHRYNGVRAIFQDRATGNERCWTAISNAEFWSTEPAVGRILDGIPHRMDRLRGLGNAVVPQVAELVGHLIVTHAARERDEHELPALVR